MPPFPSWKTPHIQLNATEAKRIADFVRAQPINPYGTTAEFEEALRHAWRLLPLLPPQVLEALLAFRAHGTEAGILLIRGLPVESSGIGPTPAHWAGAGQTKGSCATEVYLLALASLLGEVIAFNTQHAGQLIQNLVPVPSDAHEQVGTGSAVFLDWHTEDAYHRLRADFIGLLCLRADPAAATTFAAVKHMRLPDSAKRVLFEPRFRVTAFDDTQAHFVSIADGPALALLWGREDDPFVRYDPYTIQAAPRDAEAQAALTTFSQAIGAAAFQVALQEGDLLFLDNHRVLHGRTPFTPRFDGSDRWLQRICLTTDLRKSRLACSQRSRVIEMNRHWLG